ncbi:MAG: hypothetical protein RL664_758 [Bacteroidota bacterium]
MIRICFAIFLSVITSYKGFSQNFIDVSNEWGIAALNASTLYGTGSSAFDVNEDGWDDLTICIAGAPTRLYINQQGTFQLHTTFENIYDSKTCLWGDYDEDGDNDLFIIKRDGPSQLFVQTDSLVFVNQSSWLSFLFVAANNSFGAALGDYNRDSFLDLYVANYSTANAGGVKSTFLTNNQNGTFQWSTHGYSRNHFQPVFLDFNRDLFQDIFVINDFKVGNELYMQSTNGVFTDLTSQGALGLSGEQYLDAMSNSWCDYDNDGDFDLYVTNTPYHGNYLMENNGTNFFSNVALTNGSALFEWSWSALWFDIENDGWNDIIVCSRDVNPFYVSDYGNYVLRNTQGQFTNDLNTGLSNLPYGYFTSSKGDFNNDGLYDIYMGAETGQTSKVFKNTTNSANNYAKIRLKGRLSNRNGVGTYIDYFVNGEHRIHYTHSGENYLSQNSQNIIFGLGENNQIDSLKLSWLSGVVDTYYNIPANSTHIFVEGETQPGIQASKKLLCLVEGDSLQLSISGWPTHIWQNGSNSSSMWVYAPGTYTVTVGTGFGHSIVLSYTVEIASSENFVIDRTHVLCHDGNTGSIQISESNTGELIYTMENLTAGLYTIPLNLAEGCVVMQQIVINEPLPFQLVLDSLVNTCEGVSTGQAFVLGMDGTEPYSGFNEFGILHLTDLSAGMHTGSVSDSNGCFSVYNFTIDEIPPAIIEVVSQSFVCPNDQVIFDAIVSGVVGNFSWDVLSPGALLGAGDYFSAVIDSFQCVTTVNFTIEEIQFPEVSAIISESTLGLGSILLDVVGNYPPYSATWQSGFIGLNYTGLAQGNYHVSISDSFGCAIDTSFTVSFDFVEEENVSTDFIVDWKEGVLKYTGSELIFDLEIFNSIGQLIYSKSLMGTNELIRLNISPQTLYVTSSKGNSRARVILR